MQQQGREPGSRPPQAYGYNSHMGRSSRGRPSLMRRSLPVLWVVVIILVLLNLVILYALNVARLTAIEALGNVENTLDKLASEVVIYDVQINQQVPMRADVPFNQTMDIPLNTVIPIDQVFTVPFGGVDLDLPLKTDFPVNMVVPVTLNETINVDTAVQLNTSIPVEIDIARTPLSGYITQAKQDIARLKSRLAFQNQPPSIAEAATITEPEPAAVADTASTTTDETSAEAELPPDETTDSAQTEAVSPADLTDNTAASPACIHPYFPVQPGTTWTYNNPNNSYTQRVDMVVDNQVQVSTQYEGQDLRFSLDCAAEGVSLNSLGDMRRISEFGDLRFSDPQGAFLPDPETLVDIGNSWNQTYQVSGTVTGQQGDQPVIGQISGGQAQATYTPTGFEPVDTPLGPQEALRLEQTLTLDLPINFDLDGQSVPATEHVELTNVYWFAENIGLVKIHWQGGTMAQTLELDDTPTTEQTDIPALTEDQLVFVCAMFEGGALECNYSAGVSQADLSPPAVSELTIPDFVLPGEAGAGTKTSDLNLSDDQSTSVSEADTSESDVTDNEETTQNDNSSPTPDNANDGSALLLYAAAVQSLAQKISAAAGPFKDAALAYRDAEITIDEFQAKFNDFSPKIKGLIQQINQLSPPSEAQAIHQKLTGGLAKCNQGVDMLNNWFETFDDGLKEPATLMVAVCINEVSDAGEELESLLTTN